MTTTTVVSIASGSHRARVLATRDALVLGHLSLVAGLARAVARCLPEGAFDLDDLIAIGNLALCDAAIRYRPCEHGGTPFACWARLRVRGAILDSVRRRNWTEATRPGLTKYKLVQSNLNGVFVQIDDGDIPELDRLAVAPAAPAAIDAARRRRRVALAISTLPSEEAAVLERKYGRNEETFAQIAARLRVKPRRVEALHARAIAGLRRELRAA